MHTCTPSCLQVICMATQAQSGVCVVNEEMVQEQNKTSSGIPLMHAWMKDASDRGLEEESCCSDMCVCESEIAFGFWIRIQDEIDAAHRRLRMHRVNLEENASASCSLWIENRCWFFIVRRERLLSLLNYCCSVLAVWGHISWSASQGYLCVQWMEKRKVLIIYMLQRYESNILKLRSQRDLERE